MKRTKPPEEDSGLTKRQAMALRRVMFSPVSIKEFDAAFGELSLSFGGDLQRFAIEAKKLGEPVFPSAEDEKD